MKDLSKNCLEFFAWFGILQPQGKISMTLQFCGIHSCIGETPVQQNVSKLNL